MQVVATISIYIAPVAALHCAVLIIEHPQLVIIHSALMHQVKPDKISDKLRSTHRSPVTSGCAEQHLGQYSPNRSSPFHGNIFKQSLILTMFCPHSHSVVMWPCFLITILLSENLDCLESWSWTFTRSGWRHLPAWLATIKTSDHYQLLHSFHQLGDDRLPKYGCFLKKSPNGL